MITWEHLWRSAIFKELDLAVTESKERVLGGETGVKLGCGRQVLRYSVNTFIPKHFV